MTTRTARLAEFSLNCVVAGGAKLPAVSEDRSPPVVQASNASLRVGDRRCDVLALLFVGGLPGQFIGLAAFYEELISPGAYFGCILLG